MAVKSKAKVSQHMVLARRLIRHFYGNKRISISSLSGGLSNFVYLVKLPSDELVVRISDKPEKITGFLREQWAVDNAREHKIPVPEILEVGNEIIPAPYMIIRKIKGVGATDHVNRMQLLFDIGAYAAKINAIPTNNYGSTFNWSGNILSKNNSWKDYMHKELRVRQKLDVLVKHKMIFPKNISAVKAIFKEMESWKERPSLSHGDIRLKNVMVDNHGKIISIIDWENCTSNIAPFWDLSISLHDLSIDEQEQFLKGYGISPAKYNKMAPFIKTLNILHYAPLVEREFAMKNFEQLKQYRIRINGSMDMFSL